MFINRNVTFPWMFNWFKTAPSFCLEEQRLSRLTKVNRINYCVFVEDERRELDSRNDVKSYILIGKNYLENLKQLAEAYPGTQRKQVKIVQAQRDFQRLCEKREYLVNSLRKWLSGVSTSGPQKFGEYRKGKKQLVMDKFGQEFANCLLELNLSIRKPFVTILLADFPVTTSIWKRMQRKRNLDVNNSQYAIDTCETKDGSISHQSNFVARKQEVMLSSQEVEEQPDLLKFSEGLADMQTREFYEALFESMSFHPKGVVASYRLRETLECLLQPSFETPAFIYFGNSTYDWELYKDSLESCLQQLLRYVELFYRQCFLEVGILEHGNLQRLLPFYRKSLEISACSSSESSRVAMERFVQCGRRIFHLYHKQFPSYPLAFADVVVTSRIPHSVREVVDLQLDWNDVMKNQEKTSFNIVVLECVPSSDKHIRAGFHHELLSLLLYDCLPQIFGNIGRRVYSLSHISGFLSWLCFQYEIALGLRPQHRSLIPHDSVQLIGEIIRRIQTSGCKEKEMDKEMLEKAKSTMLSLCAHYLLIVRRRDGLPVDPNCAFHIMNGAELHQLLWAADEGMKGLTESAHIMSMFCYHLERRLTTAYKFASTSKISTSNEIENLLQLKSTSTDDDSKER
ncbi:Malonyl-CoA decarboxylase, mitochondrial [Galdieria sulphuraria]|nr:Malonyl-CoA decarboxylase, mitochondrial [Galdieria sulphuraria]